MNEAPKDSLDVFQTGDTIDITVKGALLIGRGTDGLLQLEVGGRRQYWWLPPDAEVTKGHPAWWPPRPGDHLRDGDGDLWIAYDKEAGTAGSPDIWLLSELEDLDPERPERVREDFGLEILSYRPKLDSCSC